MAGPTADFASLVDLLKDSSPFDAADASSAAAEDMSTGCTRFFAEDLQTPQAEDFGFVAMDCAAGVAVCTACGHTPQ
eukprot:gene908-2571_t